MSKNLFIYTMQMARKLSINYLRKKSSGSAIKGIQLNTILELVFNKGLSLMETAKLMNLTTAEVALGLRTELKNTKIS